MEQAKTQIEEVKRHLMNYGHLTSIDAITRYGITRLADIIYKLRKQEMNIETIPRTVVNRYGNSTRIAVYKISELDRLADKF